MEDHFKDNHQNNEDGTYEAVCFVCRRPESKVGHIDASAGRYPHL